MLQDKWLIRCRFLEIWRHIDMKTRRSRTWESRIWRRWSLKHWNSSIHTSVWLCLKLFWLYDNAQYHDIDRFLHRFVKQFECDRHLFIRFYMSQKISHSQRKQLIVAKWVRRKSQWSFIKNFISTFHKFRVFIWKSLQIRKFLIWSEEFEKWQRRDCDDQRSWRLNCSCSSRVKLQYRSNCFE